MANTPPTGTVTITGTAAEDQVLMAVSTLADVDVLGTLHYQWQHDVGSGFVNVGADQSTYTLGNGDIGGTVRVVVLYTDAGSTVESVTSAATAAVVAGNDAPTGGVSVTGLTTENQVLTADTSTLADSDGLGTLHYQWQHDVGSGYVDVGLDQATYTLGDDDVGGVVRVVVRYTDGQNFNNSVTSAATAAIANVNDAPTGAVTITGTLTENQVLTADTATLVDADGLGTRHYQWQRDTGSGFVNVGIDQATYTLGDADVGGTVRVLVGYTDQGGTTESATSAATAAIAGVNDPHTGGVSITGLATEDQVLTAVSTLSDVDGLGTLHYQWQHNVGGGFVNVGTDQSTYVLGDADVGAVVRVEVSYTDGQNFNNNATSAPTAAIANINDAPTGGVTISGAAVNHQTLTANTAALADVDGLGTLHYQWQHDVGGGFVNVGLDQATYTLGAGDVGGTVRVLVGYIDQGGTTENVPSAATVAIVNVNSPHTGGVTVTGTGSENQVLAAVSTLSDVDGLGTLHYQWQHDTGSGYVNVGTDQATYTTGDADVGGTVRAVVSFTDGQGTPESATSAATAAIAAVNDPHTGGVSITGIATEDQVLTAVSALSDVDGLGTLHYQWQHDVGGGYVNVGLDQATYTLGDGDVGGVVRVVVSYTDGQDFFESATSSATAAIANVNDAPVNDMPASLNAAANTNVAISGLAVSDVDSASLMTTLRVEHGTLDVAAIGGATVVGSGSSTVTLTGSVAEIDATLGAANNVLYHSAFNFNGIDHLTMTSSDGPLSDTDVLEIQMAPALAAYTINGITRPALNLDSAGHIILDQPAADFASAYGIRALYLGVPASTPYPPVAAQDFHLI